MRLARKQPNPFSRRGLVCTTSRWRPMRPGLGTSHYARSFGARVHPGCDFVAGGLNSGKYLRLWNFTRHNRPPQREKKMREAVIVSYARTGLAKSGRGGFNITPPMSMAAHAIKHAVQRAGVDKEYVEDCYLGNCAHGAPNIGRQAALLAGMPKSTAGVSVNRFCSSGLQTIAMAANSIRSDGADCIVAGGVESISVPGGGTPKESIDPDLLKAAPDIFMAMIDTADIVAERYKLSREYQDEYSLESQRRMAAAQQASKFKDEGGRQGDEGREHRRLCRRPRRVQPARHHHGGPRQARAGEGSRQIRHRRQCQPAVGWRGSRGVDGSQGRRKARPSAARPLCRLGGGGLRAGRDGHRAGVRGAEAVEAPWSEGR